MTANDAPWKRYEAWQLVANEFVRSVKEIWDNPNIKDAEKRKMISNGMKQVNQETLDAIHECSGDAFALGMLRSKSEQTFMFGLLYTGMTSYEIDPTYL